MTTFTKVVMAEATQSTVTTHYLAGEPWEHGRRQEVDHVQREHSHHRHVEVVYEVTDGPTVAQPMGARPKTGIESFRPDRAIVMYFDGRLDSVTVTGVPREEDGTVVPPDHRYPSFGKGYRAYYVEGDERARMPDSGPIPEWLSPIAVDLDDDEAPVLLPRPDGTGAFLRAGDVRALIGYVEQRDGRIAWLDIPEEFKPGLPGRGRADLRAHQAQQAGRRDHARALHSSDRADPTGSGRGPIVTTFTKIRMVEATHSTLTTHYPAGEREHRHHRRDEVLYEVTDGPMVAEQMEHRRPKIEIESFRPDRAIVMYTAGRLELVGVFGMRREKDGTIAAPVHSFANDMTMGSRTYVPDDARDPYAGEPGRIPEWLSPIAVDLDDDERPVYLPRPDGTGAFLTAGDVRALIGHVEQSDLRIAWLEA